METSGPLRTLAVFTLGIKCQDAYAYKLSFNGDPSLMQNITLKIKLHFHTTF